MDGSRTHLGSPSDPAPVLKTGEPTGTHPLPRIKHTKEVGVVQGATPLEWFQNVDNTCTRVSHGWILFCLLSSAFIQPTIRKIILCEVKK